MYTPCANIYIYIYNTIYRYRYKNTYVHLRYIFYGFVSSTSVGSYDAPGLAAAETPKEPKKEKVDSLGATAVIPVLLEPSLCQVLGEFVVP